MRYPPAFIIAFALVMPSVATASRLFYTDQPAGSPGSIMSVGLDGSSPSTVVTFPGSPNLRGIGWHRASGRIFVLDNGAKIIRSIFPNGSSQMDVTAVSSTMLGSDLEVDDTTNKIFWSETNTSIGPGFIRSVNPDGTDVATVVTAGNGSESPYFFFLDRPGGFIYWGSSQALSGQNDPTTYRRASFAGVVDPVFGITTPTRSRDIVVDPTTSVAYWADRQQGAIFKEPVSGGIREIVISGLNAPHGLVFDQKARKLYWVDTGQRGSGAGSSSRRAARCNFDGSESENLTEPTGLNEPWDLTLDLSCPTYADWRARFFRVVSAFRDQSDDADQDGLENVLEYAFDSHPLDGASLSGPTPLANGISYPRRRVSPLTYRVEVSTDMATWRYNGDASGQIWTVEDSVTPIDAEMDTVVVEPAAELSGAPQLFYRIKVLSSEGLTAAFSTTLKQAKASKAPRKAKAIGKRARQK
jgi:hypothetical protein